MHSFPNDLIHAKKLFQTGSYTCVLCQGNTIVTSSESGVKPLVEFLKSHETYEGFSAADRIIGKAAAHLYLLMEIAAVHATVMSIDAAKLLSEHSVVVSYDIAVDSIINRAGNGPCPMEQAVSGITDSQIAFHRIQETIELLRRGK